MKKYASKLLRFLLARVVDDDAGDPPVDPPADIGALGDGSGDDLDDPIGDLVDDEPTPPVSARRGDDSRERLARLEAEVEAAKRYADNLRNSQPAPSPQADPEFQREEERLRASDLTDLERWQIQSNRTLRENKRQAEEALRHAQDVSDRAQFQSQFQSDPRRSKYADRIEQELTTLRQRGQNAPREALYYFMLGKDIAEGKLKAKPKAPPADLPRGRTPGAKTDVTARGGKNEHQKRAERLANINI